jgi:hypothetical protein
MLAPTQLLHLNGPLPQPRNLLFRYVTEHVQHRRVWVPPCTFGGKQAQTATLTTPFHHGCYPDKAIR